MSEHRFRAFLRSREWEYDLGRRFVNHAAVDGTLPDAESWEELESYLNEHNAPEENIRAAEYVWRLYAEER